MINDIQNKLKNYLQYRYPFRNERDVVYFLVEIRKIIEKEKTYKYYPIVSFYCDWIVHPQIDHKKTISNILHLLKLIEEGKGYVGMSELYSMSAFRENMSSFLTNKKIKDFTKNEQDWRRFFINLKNILVEQPIVISEEIDSKIAFIKYVDTAEENYIPLDIVFKKENGHERGITFNGH